MYHQLIKEWLDKDCPFLPGVRLYQQIGGPYPVSIFLGYEQAHYVPQDIQQRLKLGLQDYLNKHPKQAEQKVERKPTPTPAPPSKSKDEPAAIVELRQKAIKIHKHHAHIKSKLSAVETDEERYAIASEIMEKVIPRLDHIYTQIRHWEATGELPSIVEEGLLDDPKALANKINTVGSRVSKIRGLLKGELTPDKRAHYKKQLLEKELELQRLKA